MYYLGFYKKIVALIIVLGLILLIVQLSKLSVVCPPSEIIYRYVPRTFEEENAEPVNVTDIFKTMFSQPGVWEQGFNNTVDNREVEKYFASQT